MYDLTHSYVKNPRTFTQANAMGGQEAGLALSQRTLRLVQLEYAELASNDLRKEAWILSYVAGSEVVREAYHRVIFKETDS